jgi:hypothetical protein
LQVVFVVVVVFVVGNALFQEQQANFTSQARANSHVAPNKTASLSAIFARLCRAAINAFSPRFASSMQ